MSRLMAPKDMLGGVGVLPFQDSLILGWLRYWRGGALFSCAYILRFTNSLESDTLLKKKKKTSSYLLPRTCVDL